MKIDGQNEQYPGAPRVRKGTTGGKPTEEAAARRAWFDHRNAEIQRVGPRPVDGVTFGTGKPPKA